MAKSLKLTMLSPVRLINDEKLFENLLENMEQWQVILEELIPIIEKLKGKG